jgi:hypothetical protein
MEGAPHSRGERFLSFTWPVTSRNGLSRTDRERKATHVRREEEVRVGHRSYPITLPDELMEILRR